ncbi:MAG: hypothetical protein PUD72_06155 [Oscillospiraceae bacterium]|nr:hypothetical protein [Oscillospiraceae bacterium]
MEFRDINTEQELKEFLANKAKKHNFFQHYTTIDAVRNMFQNGMFHFTKGTALSLNDQNEGTLKGTHVMWDRTYISSFSYGTTENMAMWGLYCVPWEDAVRITIPKKEMLKWINETKEIYAYTTLKTYCKINEPFELIFSDIVYISDSKSDNKKYLNWNDKSNDITNKLKNIEIKPSMTGLIKNGAWKYENETRMLIRANLEIPVKHLAIKVPDYIKNSMKITTGPNFQGNFGHRIGQIDHIPNIQPSHFQGLVNYRSICEKCKYEFEEK